MLRMNFLVCKLNKAAATTNKDVVVIPMQQTGAYTDSVVSANGVYSADLKRM